MRPRRRLSVLAISALLAFSALPLFAAPVAATPVGDEGTFRDAWGDEEETLITLTANIAFDCDEPDDATRDSIVPIVVDGAGWTLSNPCDTDTLEQDGTGLVTLRNLILTGNSDSGDGLNTAGAAVVEGSTVTGHGDDAVDTDGDATVTNSTLSDNGDNGLEHDDLGGATVSGSTLSGNDGGGIQSDGDVTVSGDSTISLNGDDGIDAEGDVTVSGDSTISLNGLDCCAGGINAGGTVTVSGASDIIDNGDNGISANGNVTVSDSTVSGNGEVGEGGSDGIVSRSGNVEVTNNSIVSDNFDSGIVTDGGNVTVRDSTISDNGEDGIRGVGDVTVSGSTISANGKDDICADGIHADGGVSVTTSTISDNADSGIFADGAITVTNSEVSGNGVGGECDLDGIHSQSNSVVVTSSTVSDNRGAGIYSEGDATVTDSTVSDNHDGIRAFDDAVVSRSTVSGNGGQGGSGVVADNDATVTDSTITANADSGVDAIFGDATVTNSTVTDNVGRGVHALVEVFATNATITGNGVNVSNENLTTIHLFGTVLVGAEVNCEGSVDDQGFNFVDDLSCGDIPADLTPHLLGELANNGGPTWTRLPADNSPLIDGIPSAQCRVTTDQRGIARPQGGGCDKGAVEVVPPAASINDVTVTEGNTGTTVNAAFTVTLSRASAGQVTISYATADGTAIAPADYQANSGTVTFVPGDVSETITIAVVGDGLDEPNETFVVNLSAPVGASLADAQGTGTILDDDAAPAAPTPTPTAIPPTQAIAAATGTPAPGVSNTALSQSGASPIPTIAFALILLASLLTLAYANVRTVRNRR